MVSPLEAEPGEMSQSLLDKSARFRPHSWRCHLEDWRHHCGDAASWHLMGNTLEIVHHIVFSSVRGMRGIKMENLQLGALEMGIAELQLNWKSAFWNHGAFFINHQPCWVTNRGDFLNLFFQRNPACDTNCSNYYIKTNIPNFLKTIPDSVPTISMEICLLTAALKVETSLHQLSLKCFSARQRMHLVSGTFVDPLGERAARIKRRAGHASSLSATPGLVRFTRSGKEDPCQAKEKNPLIEIVRQSLCANASKRMRHLSTDSHANLYFCAEWVR